MSYYTTELRYICETYAGYNMSQDRPEVRQIIEKARPKIFDFDYPLYDPAYKRTLETKIIRHFYTREIGVETVGLWRMHLETLMNEIMPKYNQLYRSAVFEFDPSYDTYITKDYQLNKSGQSSETHSDGSGQTTSFAPNTVTEVSGDNYNFENDTPQGRVTQAQIDSNDYLTRFTKGNGTNRTTQRGEDTTQTNGASNGESASNFGNVDNYVEHIKGITNRKSQIESIAAFRDLILNVDMLIINELEVLFMNIF